MINFVQTAPIIGGTDKDFGNFKFYENNTFELNGSISEPTWQDVTIAGQMSLTLLNAKANGLNYLKAFGKCEQRKLPEGYTELEYLQSDASAYINTHFNSTSNSGLKIKYRYVADGSAAISGIYTSASTASRTDALFVSSGSGTTNGTNETIFATTNGYSGDGAANYPLSLNTDYVAEVNYLNSGEVYINNTFNRYCGTKTPNNSDVLLFARKNASNDNITASNSRIYYAIFTENQTVSKYFIPAKRNSDNVLGMYDVINDVFETNAGTGAFTAGADVTTPTPDNPIPIWCNNGVLKVHNKSGLPLGYQKLEYLESSGTQYIDTNLILSQNNRIILDFEYTNTSSSARLFGARTTATSRGMTISSMTGTLTPADNRNQVSPQYGAQSGVISDTPDLSINTKYHLDFNKKVFSMTGNNYSATKTFDVETFTTEGTCLLFGSRNSTSTIVYAKAKIYDCEIYDNDTLVRDFIPAKRNLDNVLGMYDTVTNTFFTNAGTGTFTAGADVDDMEIYTDGTQETVTITGKNLFDPTKVLFGYYRDIQTGNKQQNSYNFMSSDDGYIPCFPNTTYTFVGRNKTDGTYSKYNTMYFFDSAKNYLGASPYEVSQPTTGTTPNNCHYLQIRSNPLDNVSVSIQDAFSRFNWQLELGSTATTYETYFNGGTATAENLLSIGDYKDVQEVLNGDVTRNIGIKVLKGTEDFTLANNCFMTTFSDRKTGKQRTYPPLCTHFIYSLSETATISDLGFGFNSNIGVYFKYLACSTVPEFKTYLAQQYANGTPVIVVYPLATPTTETVTGQPMTIQAGTNIIEVTQSSIDDLELEAQYKAGVMVTITEIENVNLDNSVTVTIS